MNLCLASAATPVSHSWATSFEQLSLFHAVTVAVSVAITLTACVLATRNQHKHENVVRNAWVVFTVITQLFALVWYLLPSNFDPQVSWPLHVCDLAAWFVPLALLTKDARARALLYFWGIGLSSQAFFTPVLSEGYTDLKYWFFWLSHIQIVGGAIFDVWVRGYRPTLRHFRFVIIAGLMYMIMMVWFNEILGTNYCYVGRSLPNKRTVLHALPPWPWRVVVLLLLAVLAQFLSLLPWLLLPMIRLRLGLERSEPDA